MGRLYEVNLDGNLSKIYSCRHCGTHLALTGDVLSKSFQSRNGRAYLLNKVVNVTFGEKVERQMMTGSHVVKDIFCIRCGSSVGWNYETAHEKSQKYKEGKSVLERRQISGPEGSANRVRYGNQNGGSDGDDAE